MEGWQNKKIKIQNSNFIFSAGAKIVGEALPWINKWKKSGLNVIPFFNSDLKSPPFNSVCKKKQMPTYRPTLKILSRVTANKGWPRQKSNIGRHFHDPKTQCVMKFMGY